MGMFNTPDGGLFLGIKSDRQYRQASQTGQSYNDFVAQQQAAAQAHRRDVDTRLEQNGKPIGTFSAQTKAETPAQPQAKQPEAPKPDEAPGQPVDVTPETVFDESAMAGAFEEGVNTGRAEIEAGVQARIDEAVSAAVNSATAGLFDQATLDSKLAEATEAAKAGLFDQATLDSKITEAVNAAKQTYINNLNSYLDGEDCADIREAICQEVLVNKPQDAPATEAPNDQPAQ